MNIHVDDISTHSSAAIDNEFPPLIDQKKDHSEEMMHHQHQYDHLHRDLFPKKVITEEVLTMEEEGTASSSPPPAVVDHQHHHHHLPAATPSSSAEGKSIVENEKICVETNDVLSGRSQQAHNHPGKSKLKIKN